HKHAIVSLVTYPNNFKMIAPVKAVCFKALLVSVNRENVNFLTPSSLSEIGNFSPFLSEM
ncbi:hypothetical protein, partial [Vibrio parahaemolyticus]|uniref:hypothetical protein n=1 Tax=Vibrio parahaemolyticus TaxID=670 RepID=UPI00116F2C86